MKQLIQHFQFMLKQLLELVLKQLLKHLFLFRAHWYQISMDMRLKLMMEYLGQLVGEKCNFHFHHWDIQLHKSMEYLVEYIRLPHLKLNHLSMKLLVMWMELLVKMKVGELGHSLLECLFQIHIGMSLGVMQGYSFRFHHCYIRMGMG